MLWVGLTGGIGTGKSTVTRILRQLNIPVIDADELAREVVKPGSDGHREVVKLFGPSAVNSDGDLNRKEIGRQVFSDRSKLEALEMIIHPKVRTLTNQRKDELSKKGEKIAFYDVPLLFEKKMENLFDQIVVVTCNPTVQLQRLVARDGFTEDEAKKRISSQLALEHKVKAAHFTIHNNDSFENLKLQVNGLLEKLRAL